MRDQDDRNSLIAQLRHKVQQRVGLLHPQSGCRLIHDQDRGIEADRPRNRHHLALTPRHPLDQQLGRTDVDPQPRQQRFRLGVHPLLVQKSDAEDPLGVLPPGEHIGGNVQIVEHRQVLVYHRQPQRLRVAWIAQRRLLPFDEDLACVRNHRPVERLHQRGLSGRIVAYQAQQLPAPQLQIDAVQRLDGAKSLRDSPHLNRVLNAHGYTHNRFEE